MPDISFLNSNKTLIFSIDLNYTSYYKTAQKSLQWEPSCPTWKDGRLDRQTWRSYLRVAFRSFVNAPNNYPLFQCLLCGLHFLVRTVQNSGFWKAIICNVSSFFVIIQNKVSVDLKRHRSRFHNSQVFINRLQQCCLCNTFSKIA
jgi:hypothetical protein